MAARVTTMAPNYVKHASAEDVSLLSVSNSGKSKTGGQVLRIVDRFCCHRFFFDFFSDVPLPYPYPLPFPCTILQ